MYVVGQTVEVIINTDKVECIYEQVENGTPAIKARTQNVNATLGLYKTKESIDQAMADLALALMAGDERRLQVYMMRQDGVPQEIKQTTGEAVPDGEQKGTEPAGGPGMDGSGGNRLETGAGAAI